MSSPSEENKASFYHGADEKAIQQHYDISNSFYGLWLDPTMTYSCALWEKNDDLLTAQLRKIDFHLTQSQIKDNHRVLDIGCGWGSTLKRALEKYSLQKAVGLTLSQAQLDFITTHDPRIEIFLENWANHCPEQSYDAIISIGAFEHFVNPSLPPQEKIATYRNFFQCCHQWLKPGGYISLQTIIYENADITKSNSTLSQIFPDSNIPHLAEIVLGAERLFEIVTLRNDREHYVKTLRVWLKNLKKNRQQAIELVGENQVIKYEKYLSISMIGFHSASLNLSRIVFRRLDP